MTKILYPYKEKDEYRNGNHDRYTMLYIYGDEGDVWRCSADYLNLEFYNLADNTFLGEMRKYLQEKIDSNELKLRQWEYFERAQNFWGLDNFIRNVEWERKRENE